MKRNVWLIACCAAALASCTSAYESFYRPMPGTSAEDVASRRVSPAPATPAVERTAASPEDARAQYAKAGYFPIGFSSFSGGGSASDEQAIEQGKRVGADLVVIVDRKYVGTKSSIIPIVTPTTNTSTTNGTATAYGSGGSATVYGSSTTTSYGSNTNFIPVSTDQYVYGAIFMVRMKLAFGVLFRDTNDQERAAIGSNRGVVVTTVVNDSPAFGADILVGDIITTIDGQRATEGSLPGILADKRGKTINVEIIRGSDEIRKSVSLAD